MASSKTLCFTGHRPSKLKGYSPEDNKELLWRLYEEINQWIEAGVDTFITGMALGIDTWAAKIVLRYKRIEYPHIKLICAIPCKNQQKKWKQQDQRVWTEIIEKADEVIYVSEEEYTNTCMQIRNEWMVDNSDIILGVWDGSAGGTANCINYAQRQQKEIKIIEP